MDNYPHIRNSPPTNSSLSHPSEKLGLHKENGRRKVGDIVKIMFENKIYEVKISNMQLNTSDNSSMYYYVYNVRIGNTCHTIIEDDILE